MPYINYCINLTEEEKREIDAQVRKNQFELKLAVFFPFPIFPFPVIPNAPLQPVQGLTPRQIVRSLKNRAESTAAEKLAPLAQLADDCKEAEKKNSKFIRICLLH